MGMEERRDLYFTIVNNNPVGVTLRGWGSNLTGIMVELMGVEAGNETQVLQRGNFSGMSRSLQIPPWHYMAFRIGIDTHDTREGQYNGTVYVETDRHKFEVPFTFTVARGSLNTVPRELAFEPVFPGRRAELKLKVYSSFEQEMVTDSVSPTPPDPRFLFVPESKGARIYSGVKNLVGKVVFDAAAACKKEQTCYAGFTLPSKVGREWYRGLTLHPEAGDSDVATAHTLYNRYKESVNPVDSFNITLNLDTDQVRGFLFKAQVKLAWPRVVPSSPSVNFGLAQVGNHSFRDVVLENPSQQEVFYHLVPLSVYPNGHRLASLLPKTRLGLSGKDDSNFTLGEQVSSDTFRVMHVIDAVSKQPLRSFGDDLEERHGAPLHADTKVFVLRGGQSAKVRIRFRPTAEAAYRQVTIHTVYCQRQDLGSGILHRNTYV